jgi:hypothetical protein
MVEEKAKKKEQESCQRKRKWIWVVAIVILTVAIGCYLLLKTGLLDSQNVDEQLAAIEAARAIPDEENAAIIYYQLLEDYGGSEFSTNFLSNEVYNLTIRQPWLSKDYPELAEWLKEQQDIISTLLEASEKEKCRFPIITDAQRMHVGMEPMREWARLLVRAANNDIAEGRIDAGIQKCNCCIQMGKHLCQQPSMINYLVGFAVEDLAMERMKTFILKGDVSETHLKAIEAAIPQSKDNWAGVSPKIMELETLYERKNVSYFSRVRYWRLWRQYGSTEDIFDRFHEIYLGQLADRRGSRVFIALRRYKNKNGRWPEKLDDIKSIAPAEILVDPMNGGSFIYMLTDDSFTLYSKGQNNIDEAGEYKSNWPEKAEPDDWLIWPPGSRKTKNEKADTQQSNTQKDVVK